VACVKMPSQYARSIENEAIAAKQLTMDEARRMAVCVENSDSNILVM
jgi:hypothetical protein